MTTIDLTIENSRREMPLSEQKNEYRHPHVCTNEGSFKDPCKSKGRIEEYRPVGYSSPQPLPHQLA